MREVSVPEASQSPDSTVALLLEADLAGNSDRRSKPSHGGSPCARLMPRRDLGAGARSIAGVWPLDQVSNAFRLGKPRSPSLKLSRGEGFEPATSETTQGGSGRFRSVLESEDSLVLIREISPLTPPTFFTSASRGGGGRRRAAAGPH